MTKPKKKSSRATKARLAIIERIRLLKIEKLAGEPDKHLLQAELVVAGLPDPPPEPLPAEPLEFSEFQSLADSRFAPETGEVRKADEAASKSDWLAWIRWLWE